MLDELRADRSDASWGLVGIRTGDGNAQSNSGWLHTEYAHGSDIRQEVSVSELVGVMLVESSFRVYQHAAISAIVEVVKTSTASLVAADNGEPIEWQMSIISGDMNLVHARCRYLPEFAVPGHRPEAEIDTAIAQAYDAFCLQYDLWRRASHIEWLPVLPMSLGVEPGQRSGTWTFTAAPAPKATSPEGQEPDTGRKQKQHGKTRKDRPVGEGSARKRSKRG